MVSAFAMVGIVEEHVLRRSVVEADLTGERALGVVEMAALGLNDPAHLAGIFLFPLGHHVIVRFHFEQPFKDEWKALRGRFFERQDLDVVIVDAEVAAVALTGNRAGECRLKYVDGVLPGRSTRLGKSGSGKQQCRE